MNQGLLPADAGRAVLRRAPMAVLHVAVFWAAYLAILLVASIPKGMSPEPWAGFVWGTLSSAAIFVMTRLVLKREGRSQIDVGLEASVAGAGRFLAGAAVGLGVYGLVILTISVIVGPVHVTRVPPPAAATVLSILASTLALSLMEELGFRGYPLRTLAVALGPWRAQVAVAVAFCLSHVAFGWSWQAIVFGVFPSALLFGASALATGDLMMPVGLHAAMNLARWLVGETAAPGLWRTSVDAQMRGQVETYGPFIGFAVTLLCACVMWAWGSRRSPALRGGAAAER